MLRFTPIYLWILILLISFGPISTNNGPMALRLKAAVAPPRKIDHFSSMEAIAAASATISNSNMLLCPVSSSIDLNASEKYFFYPADVYSPIQSELQSAVNCIAQDMASYKKGYNNQCYGKFNCSHLCSTTKQYCPVKLHHIHDARPSKDISLCRLKELLLNKSESVTLYVTGGSVTRGSHAVGCCRSSYCHAVGLYADRCTWIFYLAQWFKRTFPANISLIDLSESGRNSQLGAAFLAQKMRFNRVDHFTSHDVIFLDHSVNDNALRMEEADILRSAEELVRSVLTHSAPRSLPTIVLLDASPKRMDGSKCLYCVAYERVARHYGIPLWSYRKAVMSPSNADINSTYYVNFINFKEARGMHPPWHVHLFMADVYAGIVQTSMKECTRDAYNVQSAWHYRTLESFPALGSTRTVQCGVELLRLSLDEIQRNSAVGAFVSLPADSWQLRQDIKGRMGGFISVRDTSSTVQSTAGNATLSLKLNTTVAELIERRLELSVKIYYLRTFENAGIVQITFCGKEILETTKGILDALWYESYSLPGTWSPPSTAFSYQLCQGYTGEVPTIEITHFAANRKGQQKFKILHASVCTV